MPCGATVAPSARQTMRQQTLRKGTGKARTCWHLVEDQQRCGRLSRQVTDRSRIAEVRAASHCCEVMTLRAAELCPWCRSNC